MRKTQVLERGQWQSKDEPQETNDVTGTKKFCTRAGNKPRDTSHAAE